MPHQQSSGTDQGIAEERRLAYVGITRAKQVLVMTSAGERTRYGETIESAPSRFLEEIPEEMLHATAADDSSSLAEKREEQNKKYMSAFKSVVYNDDDDESDEPEATEPSRDHPKEASFEAEQGSTPSDDPNLRALSKLQAKLSGESDGGATADSKSSKPSSPSHSQSTLFDEPVDEDGVSDDDKATEDGDLDDATRSNLDKLWSAISDD